MSGERRGSLTSLLLLAPDYYSPPSPNDCPETSEDCWGEFRSRVRRAPKRPAEEKRKEEDKAAADKKKEKDAGQKATHPNAAVAQKKVSVGATKKDAYGQGITQPKKDSKDVSTKGDPKGVAAKEEDEEALPPKHVSMRGCSAAYQNAVEHVRGPAVVPSIVVLGLPETEQKKVLPFSFSTQMNKSSLVAMAASRMRRKGSKVENDQTDDLSDCFAITRDIRRDKEIRPGRKFFEDAYITTWSRSILPTEESLFAITFNTTEKAPLRTRRVSRHRLRREEESWESKASEWSDWRSVHDRVDEWLKDNGRLEPDESHMVALLQDIDTKKPLFLR